MFRGQERLQVSTALKRPKISLDIMSHKIYYVYNLRRFCGRVCPMRPPSRRGSCFPVWTRLVRLSGVKATKASARRANVLFVFSKETDGMWLAMLNALKEKPTLKRQIGEHLYTVVPVKNYSLEDHQFFQIRVDLIKAKDALVSIPRENVRGIVEAKVHLPNLFFGAA
jgi:hypothetical protein